MKFSREIAQMGASTHTQRRRSPHLRRLFLLRCAGMRADKAFFDVLRFANFSLNFIEVDLT